VSDEKPSMAPSSVVLLAVAVAASETQHPLSSETLHPLCNERFLFRQLLAGRDVAQPGRASGAQQARLFSMAKQMQNFMYLVGDAVTRECVAIDACYDPDGVLAAAEELGCNVTMAVGTHFHYDHIGHEGVVPGGPGFRIPGLRQLVEPGLVTGYLHETELTTAAMQVGLQREQLSPMRDGDVLRVGTSVELSVIATPGHSPGGVTLVAAIDGEQRLVLTGDTIFPGSCGRLDLPGSSVDAMYESLSHLRGALDESLPLFPGHAYSGAESTVAREKASGLLRPMTKAQWRRMMAR